jgi:hypothetical protein
MLVGWKAAGRDRRIASLRYRVEAPVRALQALGHQVEMFEPGHAAGYDTVVFSKTYSQADRALAAAVRKRGGKVVFDLCDNHFYNPHDLPRYREIREEILEMLSLAHEVVCATPALAEVVRSEAPRGPVPMVIGDTVEKIALPPPAFSPLEQGRRLLWYGSHGSPNASAGMTDLLLVADLLAEAHRREGAELVVCSNDREKYDRMIAPLDLPTRYVEWSLDGFPAVLASSDAVIIPINKNPFTACKTHNRLSLALYAGVPVIADGIDSYREFAPYCALDDWAGGLNRLFEDADGERARALASRAHSDRCWSLDTIALKWASALELDPIAARPAAEIYEPAPAMASSAETVRCQGGLDGRADGAVSGWARMPSQRTHRLHVRLESGGRVIARAVADQPRPDLERAQFADSDCGFVLPLDGLDLSSGAACEVVVEETGWRFDEPPFVLAADTRGHRLRFHRAGQDGARPSRSFAEPAELVTPLRPQAAVAARSVQKELLSEVERLVALVEQARSAAARLILAIGDDASLAQRVFGALAAKPKSSGGAYRRPMDPDDQPPARLN